MSLPAGARLGPYEVTVQIGAGGMGEVYSAIDTNLKRSVALKVLPASVATDSGRLTRFQREAEVLASLNHPNIAAIYGLERSGETTALVMELVEGPTLADRIGQGAIALDEALSLASQIASALEAAHEQGIVHRDLKPANIKVRHDGTVKVLDFGLAKALGSDAASAAAVSVSMAPTLTSPAMTQMGLILGTAAYMAPEQASGKPVDKRADIWAFGVVLWEMLAGRQMYEGETISHVLAAVLTREPDLTVGSPRVRPLLARCLEKDPRKRLRDIGDAMSLVQGADVQAGPLALAGSRRGLVIGGWAVAGALAAAVGALVWLWPAPAVETSPPSVRFQIERTTDVYNRTSTAFAVSPDGLLLAYYGAGRDGPQTLLVRTLATGEVRELISGAAVPLLDSLFWSWDSKQLVRGAASGAEVFDIASGSARLLCECRWVGGSWNREGTILLGGLAAGSGISRLSVGQRTPVQLTAGYAGRNERDGYPVALPDGRRFLFSRATPGQGAATYVGSLDGGAPTRMIEGSRRAFVPAAGGQPPYLLGIDASGVIAQPFDPDTARVTGPAVTLVAGAVGLSVSENGVLATSAPGSRPRTIPTWYDRKGMSLGTVGEAGFIEAVALSPDGRRLAVAEGEVGQRAPRQRPGAGSDIWLHDLVTTTRRRFSFSGGSTPVWSADGRRIAFSSPRAGVPTVHQRAADGTGAETPLFTHDRAAWVNDWSNDGRVVIYSSPSREGIGNDLWSLSMEAGADPKPVPYIVAPSLQQQAQLSPDGRFVAYGSDQGGGWEIYVQPFPNASDGKWMVSNGGGAEPRWSRDGKELFYFAGQTLMAVPVSLRPTFSAGTPVALFKAPVQPGNTNDSHRWQLAPDGRRFLLLASDGKDEAQPLDVIVNWPALLKD